MFFLKHATSSAIEHRYDLAMLQQLFRAPFLWLQGRLEQALWAPLRLHGRRGTHRSCGWDVHSVSLILFCSSSEVHSCPLRFILILLVQKFIPPSLIDSSINRSIMLRITTDSHHRAMLQSTRLTIYTSRDSYANENDTEDGMWPESFDDHSNY